MTTQSLSFKALPQLALAEGATSPNPGFAGVWVWSTTLSAPVYWNGSIWTAGATGGSSPASAIGTVTIDFGTTGSNEASVVLTGQTAILSTAEVELTVSASATSSNHTAADHRYLPALCSFTSSTPITATGFTIYARSIHELTGTWTIQYRWSN